MKKQPTIKEMTIALAKQHQFKASKAQDSDTHKFHYYKAHELFAQAEAMEGK